MAERRSFRSAEAWLRARGVQPEPVTTSEHAERSSPLSHASADASDGRARGSNVPADPDAGPHAAVPAAAGVDVDAVPGVVGANEDSVEHPLSSTLEDDVVVAMGFLRRSANAAPQSEGRLREKLDERGCTKQVIELALSRARRERLVDDHALAAALVDERRERGHAPARIRRDLRKRGFDDLVLAEALAPFEAEDLDAAAFDVAIRKAQASTGVPADTAFRRVAAHLQRRGYPDGLARKVAREAVFSTREGERAAER